MGLPAEKLEQRHLYLGGTEAAAVVGLSRRKTLLDVWAEKTGVVQREDIGHKLPVKLGNALEQCVADLFADETGKKVHRVNETLFHPRYPFLGANLDRRVVGERAILECKTTTAWLAKEWEGQEIPQEYIIQCLHYLAVTGADRCYLAVLIGNQDFKWMIVERDEAAINNLVQREVEFWEKYVVPGVMPQMVKARDSEVLFKMFPEAPDGSLISLDSSANEAIEFLQTLQRDAANLENQIEQKKNELKMMLGTNEIGLTDLYRVSWKVQKTARVDTTNLKKQKPEVWQQFAKTTESRVLRISERKEA